ncbi:MAG TPA: aminoacyl-tRNA hydrolase [Chloroflexota bacterium]|nr:aminoacyl-tRNA hydrolase [Chloroflexota bacterium]
MPPDRLIVGLGNPGQDYADHRHNLGFWCLDRLAEKHQLRFNMRRARSLVARGEIGGRDVVLAKPQTYMNVSGQAVKELLFAWGIAPASLLVIYDDVDLPSGVLRMRERGGPGTHNGMRSIVESIGTSDFPRLRIGVGGPPPRSDMADYVLSPPSPDELATLRDAVERAVEAVEAALREGPAVAMNRFNQ